MHVSRSKGRSKKVVVFIGLGSNLGDRKKNLDEAIAHLKRNNLIGVIATSPFYETAPYGNEAQPDFLNGVVKVATSLEPKALLVVLKEIEETMGRGEGTRWGPRLIDLDILFYDTLVLRHNGLRIPHPGVHQRWFVLKPMSDIEPDYEHPVLKKTIRQLLEELNG